MKYKTVSLIFIFMVVISLSACGTLKKQMGYGHEETLPQARLLEDNGRSGVSSGEIENLRSDINNGFKALTEYLAGQQSAPPAEKAEVNDWQKPKPDFFSKTEEAKAVNKKGCCELTKRVVTLESKVETNSGRIKQLRSAVNAIAARLHAIPQGKQFAVIVKSFAKGSAALTPGMKENLDAIASQVTDGQIVIQKIYGFTDKSGSLEKNKQLSDKRAQAVKKYLIKKKAINSDTEAIGKGVTRMNGICVDNRSLVIFARKLAAPASAIP